MATLFGGAELFKQFWLRALGGTFVLSYFKFGQMVKEAKS